MSKLFLLVIGLIASVGALSAQVNVNTGTLSLPPNFYAQWVVDINFGATAHSETLNLTITNSQPGFRVDMYDIAGMARANTGADWNLRRPIWNFTTQAAGTWNLLIAPAPGSPYATLSLTGVHRFVFEVTNPNATLQNDMVLTVDNGGANTASVSGTPFLHTVTGTPASGTPAAVTGTSATAYIEHSAAFAFGISQLGASTDAVRFDFDIDFGTTATTMFVSVRGLIDVVAN